MIVRKLISSRPELWHKHFSPTCLVLSDSPTCSSDTIVLMFTWRSMLCYEFSTTWTFPRPLKWSVGAWRGWPRGDGSHSYFVPSRKVDVHTWSWVDHMATASSPYTCAFNISVAHFLTGFRALRWDMTAQCISGLHWNLRTSSWVTRNISLQVTCWYYMGRTSIFHCFILIPAKKMFYFACLLA